MAKAKDEVREVYPEAACVRSTFGLLINDQISGKERANSKGSE